SSSTTTWPRSSSWRSVLPCCTKAVCWSKAHRTKSSATRTCKKPISAAYTRWSTHEPARSQRTAQLLRGFAHSLRRLAARGAQRSRGAARPQRRRQEHDLEEPDGRGDAARRLGEARRRRDRRQKEPRDRARRHAARARRAPHLRQLERRGKPAPRRAHGAAEMAARARLRDVPEAQAAARQPRHRPLGRRAADACDRPRPYPRSENHPARRAVRGARAGDRARSDGGLPRACRGRSDHRAGGAEPRGDARARATRVHHQQRAYLARGSGAGAQSATGVIAALRRRVSVARYFPAILPAIPVSRTRTAPAAVGRYVRAVGSNLRIPPLRCCLDAVRARAVLAAGAVWIAGG